MSDRAGFFERDITPKAPVYLAGFPSRRTPSEGVDDPLFLRIMALEDDARNRAALVTADLLKCPKDMAWRTKQWAEKTLGIPSSSLIINFSHTHCAPALFIQECYPHWAIDVGYVRELEQTIREGLTAAVRCLEPVRVRYGLHQAHFGVNRRAPDPERPGKVRLGQNPDGYYDPDMPVLSFHRPQDNGLKAIFYSYACHPTSKHANLVSADYPGELSRCLKDGLGENVVTLFGQGAGASIMTRFRCGTPEERASYARQWRDVAEEMGNFVRSNQMREIQLDIASAEHEFEIPCDMSKRLSEEELLEWADPSEPEIKRFVRPANREICRLWACGMLERFRTGTVPRGFVMHATRMRLAPDLQILALSGEVTAEIGRLVKDAEQDSETIFLGYCSYTDAYIPTSAMLPEEGHEATYSIYFHVRPAPFVKQIEEIILREIRTGTGFSRGSQDRSSG
jgi:hypothetical protein